MIGMKVRMWPHVFAPFLMRKNVRHSISGVHLLVVVPWQHLNNRWTTTTLSLLREPKVLLSHYIRSLSATPRSKNATPMKRSSVSFTSHLSELSDSDSSISGSEDNSRVFRRCKSYSDIRCDNKRHLRRKTTPNPYFEFTLSRELQRDVNIGLDLVLLEHIEESKTSSSTLPPSKFLPPPRLNSFDSTFGLVSLKINEINDTDNDSEDSLWSTSQACEKVEQIRRRSIHDMTNRITIR